MVKLVSFLSLLLFSVSVYAQKQGANLLKTDLLAVLAHPDDETGMAATLAYYGHVENKTIANVYCTRGEGGGNMVGTHWGPSLGLLREAELRDCLNQLGVRYCFFLDQVDWAYTESAAMTLEKWDTEATLAGLVRYIRALRPEIIATMNPIPNAGQHGHHQAAGILAVEAFSAAADPTKFPDQLKKEGLEPWQARKLFFRGSSHGPVTEIQPRGKNKEGVLIPTVAATALSNHRSQGFGGMSRSTWMRRPQAFTLVKSYVEHPSGGNSLFENLPTSATLPSEVLFPPDQTGSAERSLRIVGRPSLENFLDWAGKHKVAFLTENLPTDLPLVAGESATLQLKLSNPEKESWAGTLTAQLPTSWKVSFANERFEIPPGEEQTIAITVEPPAGNATDGLLKITTENGMGTEAQLHPVPANTIRIQETTPSIDGSDTHWPDQWLAIEPDQLVQGKVTDAADSSGRFRLAPTAGGLCVDMEIRDQTIVTNIAPNDIRGHWRSDSVELCIDIAGGSEHTLNCFKVGIFPFDATGKVRGARDADANQGPIEETAPGMRLFSERMEGGYRIQTFIPWAVVGSKKSIGPGRIGFNLLIYDGDKEDAAAGENINESRLAWAARRSVQGRPEDWGRLDIKAENR